MTSAEQAIVDAEESLLENNDVDDSVGDQVVECEEPEKENDDIIQSAQKSVSSVFSVLIKLLDREVRKERPYKNIITSHFRNLILI